MNVLEGLNDSQIAATKVINGPIMVIAGAGSGKTKVLTHRIAHLIENGIEPFNILSLTFTNKASQEMKQRISLMVGLVSMGIASLIGIILGAMAGFFGDTKLKMPRIKYWLTLFGAFMGLFYAFGQRKYVLTEAFGESISSGMLQMFISFVLIFVIILIFK
mgnify:CR=1 FL=1